MITLIMENSAGGATILRLRRCEEVTYLAAVNAAVDRDDHRVAERLTNVCPECENAIGPGDSEHAFIQRSTPASPEPQMIAVVGCMGFWLVDPRIVGIAPPAHSPAGAAKSTRYADGAPLPPETRPIR